MALALHNTVDEDQLMTLKETIKTEFDHAEAKAIALREDAIKSKDSAEASEFEAQASSFELRATLLRLVMCSVRDRDIKARKNDDQSGCDDAEIKVILKNMLEQRERAIIENEAAGKIALVIQEQEEVRILQEFLPQSLSDLELSEAASEIVAELGATCLKDMGRCVTALKERHPEQIESGRAKSTIRKLLQQDCS
jgi:uncharacterized protein YqeY